MNSAAINFDSNGMSLDLIKHFSLWISQEDEFRLEEATRSKVDCKMSVLTEDREQIDFN